MSEKEKETCSCGCGCDADCDCGCQEGKPCTCDHENGKCSCGHDHEEHCDCGCEDELITLVDDEGNEINFYEVATLERDGKYYACLEDAEDEEAELEFFELVENPSEDGETYYDFFPVEDSELYDSLFEQLQKEVDEMNCCDDGCDCGCHHHEDK